MGLMFHRLVPLPWIARYIISERPSFHNEKYAIWQIHPASPHCLFFREVTENRSYNFSRRHHDSPLPKLISKLEEYGWSNLVIAITTSLILHGQTRLAESCEKGSNYTVHVLNNEE